jgi:xanthine dehydrogenase accessory factor
MPSMEELHRDLEALARTERRVAMATLVATRGATPKKEGARMWAGEGGRVLGSVTIGGCVDARVLAESDGVLSSGEPRLLSLALGDEDAWEIGLSCAGTVDVLIERLELSPVASAVVELYRRMAGDLERGRASCLVRLLRDPARTLLVTQDGATAGSLGDPSLDEAARELARALLPLGTSRSQPITGEGSEAFFEVHAPRAHLVVVGAGHVSMPLVSLARLLGFRTTVVDSRPRFASRQRFPDADDLRVGIPSEIVEQLPLLASTAVVLTIHDYKVEVPVLRAVLASEAGYVGMLGSRRRGRGVLDLLREQGVAEQQLERVRVPVGLDIGAQTAAEIALSAIAQVVASRAGRPAQGMAERKP